MSGSTPRSGGTGTDQGELPLDSSFIRSWIRATAADLAAHRDYLTQLDAAIGDADHGVNMDRGFTAALLALEGDEASPPGRLLEAVGSAIVFKVGGASGPLYGTAFRGAASALGDSEIFSGEDLLSALRYALEGIQRLGAAVEGDKTIVDAWVPAVSAFERELRSGGSVADASARAAVAAEEGARETVPMQARKGRASYLGARSIGHQDPGATSAAMLFSALGRTARERAV